MPSMAFFCLNKKLILVAGKLSKASVFANFILTFVYLYVKIST